MNKSAQEILAVGIAIFFVLAGYSIFAYCLGLSR
jgi:hypothetical protein